LENSSPQWMKTHEYLFEARNFYEPYRQAGLVDKDFPGILKRGGFLKKAGSSKTNEAARKVPQGYEEAFLKLVRSRLGDPITKWLLCGFFFLFSFFFLA